jgi:hypothetical protein
VADSHTIPGKAAAIYDGKKTKTYSDQANFVPFIAETGGRINAAGLHFLSRILQLEAEGTAGLCRTSAKAWTDNRNCNIAPLEARLPRTLSSTIRRM